MPAKFGKEKGRKVGKGNFSYDACYNFVNSLFVHEYLLVYISFTFLATAIEVVAIGN